MSTNMSYSGFVSYLVNSVAILLTLATELFHVCQGRSLNGTDLGESKLTAATGLTTPLAVPIKPTNKTDAAYTAEGTGANSSYTSPWSVPGQHVGREFPLPLIISSPAVAVAVIIFICVTYKWHSSQLDAQARKLAMKVSDSMCSQGVPSCVPCSPCRTKRPLLPPGRACPVDDEIASGARRKSGHSLAASLPSLTSKRGPSWTALPGDQEVPSHSSPRRHSTFVL